MQILFKTKDEIDKTENGKTYVSVQGVFDTKANRKSRGFSPILSFRALLVCERGPPSPPSKNI